MRIHRDTAYIHENDRGASAAIGNFDGIHTGHQAVLEIARIASDAPLGVVTFEPHPREFFAPDAPPFRLMNAEAKAHRLEMLGVEHLYELAFNDRLASLTPEEFTRTILADRLGLVHVTVGADFCYGKDRKGDAESLERFGREMGFGVTIAELVARNGREVSSTRIREALTDGRPQDAAQMLGHLHRIEGEVIRGDQRGRDLGYPTANMSIAGLHPPKFGVYAVRVSVLGGEQPGDYNGVAFIGTRPVFHGKVPNLETYIFDFSGDLYGVHLSVALVEFIRPERQFESVDSLIRQIGADALSAREILVNHPATGAR